MLIRPYRSEDAEPLYQAAASSWREMQPWMPWCSSSYSIDNAREWVSRQIAAFASRSEFDFVIVDPAGMMVGACGLNQLDPINRRANMGYWIRTSATGHGYATAGVKLLRNWAFEHTELERLEVVVAIGNVASLRVAEKAGATVEGVLRNRLLLHGTLHDAVMHAFTRGQRAAV